MFARLCTLVVAPCLALMVACSSPRAAPSGGAPAGSSASSSRVEVLLLNGGGTPDQNFSSHLGHVRAMHQLLTSSGVRADQITVLSSDGTAPASDLAVRQSEPENFWLLAETQLGEMLSERITLANSTLPGVHMQPATRRTLSRYFADARKRLRPGDTLLVYVTDHGTFDRRDGRDNRIVLWGRQEDISVRQFGTLLASLDPGVRVVTLMSQCFSGGFARLFEARANAGLPAGNTCGYFSTTADRPAYGCYPENAGVEKIGHSYEFIEALGRREGRFVEAHAQVLVRDDTPDVPLRSSDLYLRDLVGAAARKAGQPEPAFIDELLRQAWKKRAAWEPELRLLDDVGRAFGIFSPRSLAELERHARPLPPLVDQLSKHGDAWEAALGDANVGNLNAFFQSNPAWGTRIRAPFVRRLDPPARRALTDQLLTSLVDFTGSQPARRERLNLLAKKSGDAAEAAYRMEVRQAALERMRVVLTTIAGRVYLTSGASPDQLKAYEALRACEELSLPGRPKGGEPPAPAPFPSFEDDLKLADAVLPAWLGIGFQPVTPRQSARLGVPPGASTVTHVFPNSPAGTAGLRRGDVVFGGGGQPFQYLNEVRTFTMLSRVGEPTRFQVLRGTERLELTVIPQPFPRDRLELPGPPRLSSKAPPLSGQVYRGTPLAEVSRGEHLVFFWATWCGPCKASVPEVLAFARSRGMPVVAVTDEPREDLDGFFARHKAPFPQTVVSDEARLTFAAYGVSGTPTFVLVDRGGAVRSYTTGYNPGRGIGVSGWRWDGQ